MGEKLEEQTKDIFKKWVFGYLEQKKVPFQKDTKCPREKNKIVFLIVIFYFCFQNKDLFDYSNLATKRRN